MSEKTGVKIISQNKAARHNFFIEDTFEAGLELYGTEVKSIRMGRVNLKESHCSFDDGELFVYGMHVSPYEKGNIFNRDPLRRRKLLMHKRELMRLFGLVQKKGYTLVPLSLYLRNSRVKMELALARGKKLYDKREDIARRDSEREMDRAVKERNRM